MPPLSASLLGTFDVRLDDRSITTFAYDKVRALLVYLMLEADRPHRRETLVGLFWPDFTERSARQNLSQVLSVLRGAIGDRNTVPSFLYITAQSLQFNTESNFWFDVNEFESLIDEANQHAHANPYTCNDCWNKLEQAASLYRGDFFTGFSLPDCPEFETWLTTVLEGLRQKALNVFEHLSQTYLISGEYDRALVYAQRQLTLDNLYEPAYRSAMIALAVQGQRSAALAQYDTCVKNLRDDLDVNPEPATIALYETIRDMESTVEDEIRTTLGIGRLAPAPGLSPYRGLDFFDVGDADLFVGRERLTHNLIEQLLHDGRFLAVVGASGSGKSSLVRAGLAAGLQRERHWGIAVLSPGTDPLQNLAVALSSLAHETRKPQLLVVDQFEELFTLCRELLIRQEFVKRLLGLAANDDSQMHVVIALRADFYHHCAQFDALRELLEQHQVYIGSMSREDLRKAIEVPATQHGWALEPGLVDVILRDLGVHAAHSPEPGTLPLLSHALLETWQRREGRKLVLRGYMEAGGVHGAIARTAEAIFQDQNSDVQLITRDIFVRLTELGEGTQDTRRSVSLAELTSIRAEAGVVRALLKRLTDARLITSDAKAVQVTHEALIREWPTLRTWLEQDRESLRLHRHLTEASQAWDDLGRDPGELYRGARLAQAEEWAADYTGTLNTLEQAFLEASRNKATQEAAEREAQRQRELLAAQALADAERKRAVERGRMLRWIGLAAVLLLVAAVVAVILGNRARLAAEENAELAHDNEIIAATAEASRQQEAEQREAAEQAEHDALVQASGGLAARALAELDGVSPERAVLLSLTALEEYPYTSQAESALARSVLENRPYVTLPDSGGSRYHCTVAWSPDGRYIAAGQFLQEDIAVIWDTQTNQVVQRFAYEDSLAGQCQWSHAVWSSKGERIIAITNSQTISACQTIQVWDVETGDNLLYMPISYTAQTLGIDILHTQDRIVTFDIGNHARIWDLSSGNSQSDSEMTLTEVLSFTVTNQSYHPNYGLEGSLVWDPEGTRVASVVSWDTVARVWDSVTGQELVALERHTSGMSDATWSPNGKLLATASSDGTIHVWDVASGKAILTLAGHGGGEGRAGIQAVAWSPDGTRIASAGGDRTVRVWQADTGAELLRYYGITSPWDVAWSPQGDRLVIRGAEEIRVLDMTTEIVRLFDPEALREAIEAQYSSDGRWIATGFNGVPYVMIWDALTGLEFIKYLSTMWLVMWRGLRPTPGLL
ncbi:MAG: BTAD domain-containing putative transcriptional regulator [Anaerolineae bacterium]|nr:BTAD domain-containing putative transcriptional regulator [Anaerolineae bacterium]